MEQYIRFADHVYNHSFLYPPLIAGNFNRKIFLELDGILDIAPSSK